MGILFFVSSVGDTDLAKAAISHLLEQKYQSRIFLLPLTDVARIRTDELDGKAGISRILLENIVSTTDILSSTNISDNGIDKINYFITENKIQRACIGVASSDNVIPFQIAERLEIPCTVTYEYMFDAPNHPFWGYINALEAKGNCEFAVSLPLAKKAILGRNGGAKVHQIGHLSLDITQAKASTPIPVKEILLVSPDNELVFVSGTSMPVKTDLEFLDALLAELATGKYPRLQVRMGIHPGVKDPDIYLQTLLETCSKYSTTHDQFKMILTDQFKHKLTEQTISATKVTPFVLSVNVSGPDAAQAAEKITQAVPGALLNKAAMDGKPCYFHDQTAKSYLPAEWFSQNIAEFFTNTSQLPHTREELGLIPEPVGRVLANLMARIN